MQRITDAAETAMPGFVSHMARTEDQVDLCKVTDGAHIKLC